MRRVAIYHKVLVGIRGSKHWGRRELVLEGWKNFLTSIYPIEFDAFVKQNSQRLGNLGEVLDETVAIATESEETSDLLDSFWRSPIKNSLNTFRVDGNAIL